MWSRCHRVEAARLVDEGVDLGWQQAAGLRAVLGEAGAVEGLVQDHLDGALEVEVGEAPAQAGRAGADVGERHRAAAHPGRRDGCHDMLFNSRIGGWHGGRGRGQQRVTGAGMGPEGIVLAVHGGAGPAARPPVPMFEERWLAMLPADVKQNRPLLLLTEAWIAYCRLRTERIPAILERVASFLPDQAAEPSVIGEVEFFRGSFKYWEGEGDRSSRILEGAVSQLAAKSPYVQSEAELALGLARCMAGHEKEAIRALEGRIRGGEISGDQMLVRLVGGLVLIHLLCGDLVRARADAEQMHVVARRGRLRNTGT